MNLSFESYYRARYYDPSVGRFIAEDPIRFKAEIDFYRYVKNNVANFTDPYGLKVQKCCRDVQLNWWETFFVKLVGGKHCFIKTDTVIAGMGAAGRDDLPSCPVGIKTEVRDHSSKESFGDAKCQDVPGVDEDCVNKSLKLGTPTGRWWPWNQWNTFANDVLEKCSTCKNKTPDPPRQAIPWPMIHP
jgi:hypothetical protein